MERYLCLGRVGPFRERLDFSDMKPLTQCSPNFANKPIHMTTSQGYNLQFTMSHLNFHIRSKSKHAYNVPGEGFFKFRVHHRVKEKRYVVRNYNETKSKT